MCLYFNIYITEIHVLIHVYSYNVYNVAQRIINSTVLCKNSLLLYIIIGRQSEQGIF